MDPDYAADEPGTPHVAHDEPAVDDGSSVISGLRALQHQEYAAKTHDREIPGYDSQLVARYRLLDFKEIKRLTRKVRTDSDDPEVELTMNIDMLAKACQEILVYNGDELRPLAEVAGKDAPIRYDDRLAEALAIDGVSRAREVIQGMRWTDLEISDHADQVFAWMRRASDSADGATAGK